MRTPAATNPEWQCPNCQVAYAKYRPAVARLASLATDGREMAAEAKSDGSLAALIGANILALAIAWKTGMSLRELMIVYWIQSVVIGVSMFIRIWNLRRFDTTNFKVNGRPVEETPSGARTVAFFFAFHYGFFHFGYFMFLAFENRGATASLGGYLLCAVVFALNHGYSLKRNIRHDNHGRPNIGTLMFLPYARILPMHLTFILGAHIFGGALAFFMFGLLKTVADAIMHTVEHHVLATSGTGKSVSDTDSTDTDTTRTVS